MVFSLERGIVRFFEGMQSGYFNIFQPADCEVERDWLAVAKRDNVQPLVLTLSQFRPKDGALPHG